MSEDTSAKEGRKALYCDRKNCVGFGNWSPVLLVYAKVDRERLNPLECMTTLVVCEDHKRESTPADFLTDEGWNMICAALAAAGKASPKRSWTKLDWRHFKTGEAVTLSPAPGRRGEEGTDLTLPCEP